MRMQRLIPLWFCALAMLAGCQAVAASGAPTVASVADRVPLSIAQPTVAGDVEPLAAGQAPTRTPTSVPTVARLYVLNRTDAPICYVYISPVTDDAWGEDQLDADETIAPDARRSFRLSPGWYDLLALDCDGASVAEQDDVSIRAVYRWVVAGGDEPATATATLRPTVTPRATATPGATPTPRHVRRPTATPASPTPTVAPLPTLPALDAMLCCGTTPGETGTIWSVRYPAGWTVSLLPNNPQEFYGALFSEPHGRVVITLIPGANTEPGHYLDTGDVDVWLDRFTQQRRREEGDFTEFLRESIPGVPGGRLWAGTWGEGADRGWEGYLVVVNPLLVVAPGLPQGYLTLYGLRAASPDWNTGYALYEQMFGSLRVKRVGGAWQGVPMGEPSQKPFMVRWCPTTCDWMAVDADSPDWVGDCGEPTTLWETVCRPPAAP